MKKKEKIEVFTADAALADEELSSVSGGRELTFTCPNCGQKSKNMILCDHCGKSMNKKR